MSSGDPMNTGRTVATATRPKPGMELICYIMRTPGSLAVSRPPWEHSPLPRPGDSTGGHLHLGWKLGSELYFYFLARCGLPHADWQLSPCQQLTCAQQVSERQPGLDMCCMSQSSENSEKQVYLMPQQFTKRECLCPKKLFKKQMP